MTGLGKLLRSTAFRLLLAYLVVFIVFAFFTLGYVAWNARRVLDDQIVSTIEAEITGLSEQYRTRRHPPARQRRRAPRERARRLALPRHHQCRRAHRRQCRRASAGHPRAGRARRRASLVHRRGPECQYRETPYGRTGETEAGAHQRDRARLHAAGRLPPARRARRRGARAPARGDPPRLRLVAAARRRARAPRRLVRHPARAEARRRHDRDDPHDHGGRPQRAAQRCAASGDEFDRLAQNLNAMLDRIGELMAGMKEVSDNIAHDLKTPLTRLRNKADEALRTPARPRSCARRSKRPSRRATTSSASSTRSS